MTVEESRQGPGTQNQRSRSQTLAFIRGMLPLLNASEARVAQALLDHAADVPELSVSDIARLADAAPSTVVRTAKSLLFTGFNELREVLATESTSEPIPTGAAVALQRAITAGFEQIESMSATLDPREFERAVDALAGAGRVLIAAVNDLVMLGQYAAMHLAQVGRSCETPVDPFTQMLTANLLGAGDVCFVFGRTGANRLTLRTAATAKARGATVIAATSLPRPPVLEFTDIHLLVGDSRPVATTRSAHHLTRTRIGHIVVIDAVRNALGERLDDREVSEGVIAAINQYAFFPPESKDADRES